MCGMSRAVFKYSIRQAALAAGFGVVILVDLLYSWGGWVFQSAAYFSFDSLLEVWTLPHILTNSVIFLVAALLSKRLRRQHLRLILPAATGLLLAGHALLVILGTRPELNPLISLAALLIGAGISLMLICWLLLFSGLSPQDAQLLALTALVVFALLFELFGSLPVWLNGFVIPGLLLLALGGGLWLLHGTCGNPSIDNTSPTLAKTSRFIAPDVIKHLRNPLFCVASIAFAVPVTRIIALVDSVEVGLMNKVAAATILLIVLAFFGLRYGPAGHSSLVKNFDIPRLYHISLPLVATVLVLYTLFGSILALGTSVLIFVLFYIVWVLMIPACLQAAKALKTSPVLPFCIANTAVNLVFAASTWLGKVLYASDSFFGAATFGVCMLLVLYVLMMTATVQGRKAQKPAGTPADRPADRPADAPADTPAHDPSVGENCRYLGEKHQLTPRETEVLLLLADGRDTPYIAKQLFLSKNTVRTHVKNLYVKVNVHNKQQLLDLLHSPDCQD